MATKTLTITEEAYDALKATKMNDESFSKTILRITGNRTGLPAGLIGLWKDETLAETVRKNKKLANKDAEERRKKWEKMLG